MHDCNSSNTTANITNPNTSGNAHEYLVYLCMAKLNLFEDVCMNFLICDQPCRNQSVTTKCLNQIIYILSRRHIQWNLKNPVIHS